MAFGFRVPWAPASWACGVGIVSPEIGHATEVQQVLACRPCEGGFCLWLFVHGAQAYGAGGLCWPSSGGRVFYAIVCWGRAGQVDGAVRGRCHGQVKDSGQSQQPAGRCYVCSCWWKQSEHEMRKWKNPKSTRPIFILARLQMCTVHLFFFFFCFGLRSLWEGGPLCLLDRWKQGCFLCWPAAKGANGAFLGWDASTAARHSKEKRENVF